jgi:hypothetical protein
MSQFGDGGGASWRGEKWTTAFDAWNNIPEIAALKSFNRRGLFLSRGYSSGKNSARIRAALSRLHANELAEVLQIPVYKHTITHPSSWIKLTPSSAGIFCEAVRAPKGCDAPTFLSIGQKGA